MFCIILIKCSVKSTQSGCQVESRRKQILLYVNLLYYDIVWPAREMNISHLKRHRGVLICISTAK